MEDNKDEISVKKLIIKLKEWIAYLKTKWVIIAVACLCGGILGFIYAYSAKPKYTAQLTFVLSPGSRSSGLSSLAGQFGFDLGHGDDDLFTGDNIIALFNSQRILKGAFFRRLPDSSKTLVNLIVERTHFAEGLKMDKRLSSCVPFPLNPYQLTPLQDSLLATLTTGISKAYLLVDKPDRKLSIYSVAVTSPYEDVSYYLAKYVLYEASRFYIETKTKLAKQNLDMLQHEADSLKNLLGNAIFATAKASDNTFNLNPAFQVQRSVSQQNQVNASVLGTAYGEVVRNLELAKINLQKDTPLYQIIDEPSFPLTMVKKGKLMAIIGGAFICFCVVLIFLNVSLLFKNAV